jgi:hypothetical protein
LYAGIALHRRRSADEGERDMQRQIVMFEGTDASDNVVLWETNGTVARWIGRDSFHSA